LLDAVDRRGTREFKYYCRLAAVIADEDLVSALERASESAGGAVASRAKRMLGVIRQRQRLDRLQALLASKEPG
jgi:phage-related minor tail protein